MNDFVDRADDRSTRERENRIRIRSIALHISAIYLVTGVVWKVCSDWALASIAQATGDPLGVITRFQTIKGTAFITATTLLLYFVVRRYTRSIQQTERTMQQQIRKVAEQYELAFQGNPIAMWVYDPETLRVLAVNERATQTYGYSREEFLKLRITDLRPAEDVPKLLQFLKDQDQGSVHFVGPWSHRRKDGSIFQVEGASNAITFAGKPARIVMALDVTQRVKAERALDEYRATLEKRVEDRTRELSVANGKLRGEIEERHKVEAELRKAKQLAEEASTAKSVFLANTTHEIRTPLTSIMGYADLLLDPDVSAAQRDQYVSILRQNASHLLKMIDDLLDLSRIETGNLKLTLDDYSPRDIAEQTLELLRPRAAEKGLELALDLREPLPHAIRTDGVRLRQILLNLLNNAIKFTPAGRVALELDTTAPGGGAKELRFDVADTGIGIPPEHLQRIFEPFYQVEQGENRRFGGTGLGLAISRRLAEQMGGSLAVSSEPGKGSLFSLAIPIMAPISVARQARPTAQNEARIRGHVLLAEDNANIRWLVEEYLRRAGARVTAVENGEQAVRTILSETASISLVLMDISMPGMDGIEAKQKIRGAGYTGPMVAMTAHSAAEEQSQWMEAGWDAVAGKPINRHTFIPLIARLIDERMQAGVGQQ